MSTKPSTLSARDGSVVASTNDTESARASSQNQAPRWDIQFGDCSTAGTLVLLNYCLAHGGYPDVGLRFTVEKKDLPEKPSGSWAEHEKTLKSNLQKAAWTSSAIHKIPFNTDHFEQEELGALVEQIKAKLKGM